MGRIRGKGDPHSGAADPVHGVPRISPQDDAASPDAAGFAEVRLQRIREARARMDGGAYWSREALEAIASRIAKFIDD